jgi:ubiquinone/menaquinone biosynthesis C-methylase UbiE
MDDLKLLYDNAWENHIKNGNEDFGDHELALQFLENKNIIDKQDKILEIGGGIGKLSNVLLNRGFEKITCTDYSIKAIEYGKKKYPKLDLVCMDACKLEFESETFDRCISFDLIEHLPNVDKHFSEIHRVLNWNGIYLFQTPNIITNTIKETIAARGFEWKKYHPSLQSYNSLKKKLIETGFSEIEFVKMPPLTKYKLKELPLIIRIIFKIIPWKNLPFNLQIGFWCICKKK